MHKTYDLMLYAASPHPERERLTRREREGGKGRKSKCPDKKCRQAPTGPNTSFGAQNAQGRRGRERRIHPDRLESSLVSTGFNWRVEERDRGKTAK